MADKMLKTAGFMALSTFLAKACGLVRDMMIAAYFGTGIEAEAYMTATRLPTMLFDIVIGGVISATFIPVFNGIIAKNGKKEAMVFANRFIGMVLAVCVLISAIGIFAADKLVMFLAPDASFETQQMAAELTMIMFPMIIFTGIAFSFVGILQSFGEFNIPAIMSLVSNLAVIAYFPVFGKKFGVYGLAYTMLVAWGLQVAIQIPSLIKFKYKFRPSLMLKDENIKRSLMLAGPMLISTWVQPLYTIVNTRLASGMYKGISTIEYANRLYLVVAGVFSFVVTNLIFPKMSRANANDDSNSAISLMKSSLKAIFVVILPIMSVFVVLSVPIISILYEHGSFLPEDTSRCGAALSCYSIGMIGFAVNEILSKSFFAMQNSKTPMINALISMVANIAIAYTAAYCFPGFGVCGLAVATACGSTVNAILNYLSLSKAYSGILNRSDSLTLLKIVLSAVVMGAVVGIVNSILDGFAVGIILKIAVCAAASISGFAVYLLLLVLLKTDVICDLLKKRRNN